MTTPNDITLPFESYRWSERVTDLYIERICIWADGGKISRHMANAALDTARKEHAEEVNEQISSGGKRK